MGVTLVAYFVYLVSLIVIYVGLATLLHLQFGLTGIVNFGVVGFWGLGMYTLGVLTVQYNVPYLVALLGAAVVTGVAAFILGLLILDLDSQSVLVATLAFATIMSHLVLTQKGLTNGVIGLGTVPSPIEIGSNFTSNVILMVVLLVAVGAIVAYAFFMESAPYGRLMRSIQDNETLAQSLGKSTFREKLIFFTVTSTLMGVLGALSGSVEQFLVPRFVSPDITFLVWIALILGGKKRVLGGLIGIIATFVVFDVLVETYVPLPDGYALIVPNLKLVLYGLMLVLVLMFRPLGILGEREIA